MRSASSTTSLQISVAKSLAIPASTSDRSPASFLRAAESMSRRAASILVPISASLNWIAWCLAIWRPNACRSWE